MRTLAKSMGISDVALAKQCRKANVPTPPRGWWARKEAGKAAAITPLPPLPFAMTSYLPAIDRVAGAGSNDAPDAAEPGDEPATSRFRNMATVTSEIRAAVRTIKVPAVLASPHPIVARLLKQDAQRKPSPSGSEYFSDYYGPKFTSPLQQRRLRILSYILTELERLGCKVSGSTHAGERFSINVGGHWTYILFGIEGSGSTTAFHRGSRGAARSDREGLRFDLVDHDDRTPPVRTWREAGLPLERQATEIVCGILLGVEEHARKWALWLYNDEVQRRAREAKEAKLAAEKAEAARMARDVAAAAARIT